MKKLLFIGLFLICSVAHAEQPSLAQVLEWKYGPVASTCQVDQNDRSQNPEMYICGWKSAEKAPTRSEIEQFTQEYISSGSYAKEKFDPKLAIGREAQVFSAERLIALAPYSYTINEMMNWKNFTGLKMYLDALVNAGLAIESDKTTFEGILAEQGLDLEKF